MPSIINTINERKLPLVMKKHDSMIGIFVVGPPLERLRHGLVGTDIPKSTYITCEDMVEKYNALVD